MTKTAGELIAADLPVCDEDAESDLISLCDIVITGVETGWKHFWVEGYTPEADGVLRPWATLKPLEGAVVGAGGHDVVEGVLPVALTADVVRKAVAAYMDKRLEGGMSLSEATNLVDGSYTDAVIADSILQFALYGEEVYG